MSSSTSEQKFIGGAETARRQARRKRLYQPRQDSNAGTKRRGNNVRRDNKQHGYPKSMKIFDRFFGSLLSSSIQSMLGSEQDGITYEGVMNQACSLLNVPFEGD